MCVCSLRYPARNAHAPYNIYLWHVWLYHIFPHYRTHSSIFAGWGRGVTGHKMCVLIFSTTFVLTISYSENIPARYNKDISSSAQRHSQSRQISMKPKFFSTFFRKYRVCINYRRISLLHNLSRKCRKIVKFVSITHSERNIWNGPIVATAISREKRKPVLVVLRPRTTPSALGHPGHQN